MIKQLIKEELFYQITAIISWVNVYTASVFILLDWYKLHLVSISMKLAIRNNNNAQYSYHVNRLSLNWKSNHHRTSKHVGGWLNALSSNVIGFIKPSRTTHTMPLILIGNSDCFGNACGKWRTKWQPLVVVFFLFLSLVRFHLKTKKIWLIRCKYLIY